MTSRIYVVGSINMDLTLRCSSLPGRGETVLTSELLRVPGGKGANQAVAAARLGGSVTLVAAVGDDADGRELTASVVTDGVETSHLRIVPGSPTGMAVIAVDDRSENFILVSPGANAQLGEHHVAQALASATSSDVLLLSLETPVATIIRALGASHGALSLLNLSPLPADPDELVAKAHVVILNEPECATLLGRAGRRISSTDDLATQLAGHGIANAMITRGAKGAIVLGRLQSRTPRVAIVKAPAVDSVDTTGCGDAFAGACGYALASGADLEMAARFAAFVAASAATRRGTQDSYPTHERLARENGAVPAVVDSAADGSPISEPAHERPAA